jgi:PhoH-like ATPase
VFNEFETQLNESKKISLDGNVPDNSFIKAGLYLKETMPDMTTILVTKDINLQLKARICGLPVEDYENDKALEDGDYLKGGVYRTLSEIEPYFVPSEKIKEGIVTLPFDAIDNGSIELNDNLFDFSDTSVAYPVGSDDIAVNSYIETLQCIYRVVDVGVDGLELKRINHRVGGKYEAFGIKPLNTEQIMALDALLDPTIDLVCLTGMSGTGKTLLAMAAALEQSVMNKGSEGYDKIILTRQLTDLGEKIGALPGTEEEKVGAWLGAFYDAMEYILKHDEVDGEKKSITATIDYVKMRCDIQIKNLGFMRGRSFANAFVILDESQNLTPYQIKSIITRIGKGSKLILIGNLSQIDSRYITPHTSGLTHAVMKLKSKSVAFVPLVSCERSALAELAESCL